MKGIYPIFEGDKGGAKTGLILIISMILIILAFTACGNSAEQSEQYEHPQQYNETVANHATEQTPTEQQEQDIAAELSAAGISTTPVVFSVNGTGYFDQIELTAFFRDEREERYFLLQDIASLLNGTGAQFDFSGDLSTYGVFMIYRGQNFTPRYTNNSREIGEGVTFLQFPIGTMDFLVAEVSILGTPQGAAFNIEEFASFFGFSVEWQVETDGGGVINRINTYEPTITEHGRIAVYEFLYQRPTLFINSREWTDEILAITPSINLTEEFQLSHREEPFYVYPNRFFLYDFNNSGIPDIVVGYDDVYPNWGVLRGFFVYSYINGEYQRIRNIMEWYEFFRDSEGQVFHFAGNHNSRWESINQLVFRENDVFFENIVESPLTISFEGSPEERFVAIEEWTEFWIDFEARTNGLLMPVSPLDETVPTISIRPLSALQAELTEIFSEIFN
ncbi:MAG: hypothetical protein FWG63_08715 [Defluviitaleaceae bacterium]|nr:hypothetical protein [Defluviitaleaceae bacterium]